MYPRIKSFTANRIWHFLVSCWPSNIWVQALKPVENLPVCLAYVLWNERISTVLLVAWVFKTKDTLTLSLSPPHLSVLYERVCVIYVLFHLFVFAFHSKRSQNFVPYQHHRSTQTSSKSAMDGSVSFRTKGQMNGRASEQPRERVSERESGRTSESNG